jgi:hypothetical protein
VTHGRLTDAPRVSCRPRTIIEGGPNRFGEREAATVISAAVRKIDFITVSGVANVFLRLSAEPELE